MKSATRPLHATELSKLSTTIQQLEKQEGKPLNGYVVVALAGVAMFSALYMYYYGTHWIPIVLLVVCPIIIWVMFENKYKGRKGNLKYLNVLKEIERKKSIEVIEVTTSRIIEFDEKEDEGRLFLIEQTDGRCFYLYDVHLLIYEELPFPCDKFEIYKDEIFYTAIDERIYSTGNKIEGIKVSGKVKWDYLKDQWPDDLEIEEKSLNEVLEEIKNLSKV